MAKSTSQNQSLDSFVKRQTSGATFLTLEHVFSMFFTVLVAMLIVCGSVAAIALWVDGVTLHSYGDATFSAAPFMSSWALCLAAALITICPMLWLLDTRTRAEWVKRPAFKNRLAYKAPLYVALGALALLKLGAFTMTVAVVLMWFATLGQTSGLNMMWTAQLLPAVAGLIVFGVVGWFLMRRAKGVDDGRNITLLLTTIGLLLAVVLFVSAAMVLQRSFEFSPTEFDSFRNLPPSY